jgi:hypothetical protein
MPSTRVLLRLTDFAKIPTIDVGDLRRAPCPDLASRPPRRWQFFSPSHPFEHRRQRRLGRCFDLGLDQIALCVDLLGGMPADHLSRAAADLWLHRLVDISRSERLAAEQTRRRDEWLDAVSSSRGRGLSPAVVDVKASRLARYP